MDIALFLIKSYKKHIKSIDNSVDVQDPDFDEALREGINFLRRSLKQDLFDFIQEESSDQNPIVQDSIQNNEKKDIKLLYKFLDLVIDRKVSPITFLEKDASAAKAVIIDASLDTLNNLKIYDSTETLGIREKYVRGLLSKEHSLVERDIQRMLELTDNKNRIKAIPFNTEAITLTLKNFREDLIQNNRLNPNGNINANTNKNWLIRDEVDNFIIPLLFNAPDEAGEPYWFSANIIYNPGVRASYTLKGVPKEKHSQYAQIIEKSINESFYWVMLDEGSVLYKPSIIEPPPHRNPRLSGYYAFYDLFQNGIVRGSNKSAGDFADLAQDDEKEIVKKFFDIQLNSFDLPLDIYKEFGKQNLFKQPIMEGKKDVPIDEQRLNDFLEDRNQLEVSELPEELEGGNKFVTDGVGNYVPGSPILNFPTRPKDQSLGATQYNDYFSEINELVNKDNIAINIMRLSQCDEKALQGLNDFLSVNKTVPFRTLLIEIDLDNNSKIDIFLKNLKLVLKNSSNTNLSKIELIDGKGRLKLKDFEVLQKFIIQEEVAVKIDLPKLSQNEAHHSQRNNLQKVIDKFTEINVRHKLSDSIQSELVKEKKVIQAKKERIRRTRAPVSLKHLVVDLEVATSIVEEQKIKPKSATQHKLKAYPELKIITLNDLSDAVSSKEENAFEKFKEIAGGLSKTELVKYWHTLSNNIVSDQPLMLGTSTLEGFDENSRVIGGQAVHINPQFNGFTSKALERLIRFKAYFEDGINVHQLPRGFVLIKDPSDENNTLLHYDPMKLDSQSIAPQLIEKKSEEILAIDITENLIKEKDIPESLKKIWESLEKEYDKEKNEIFRKYLPELLTLEPDKLTSLINLCIDGQNQVFNIQTLNFIFENLDKGKLSYQEPYDEKSLVSTEWMKSTFSEFENRKTFVELAHDINWDRSVQREVRHPLISLLEEDNIKLKNWLLETVQTYQLTNKELNGLLRIYSKYGEGGLRKLLSGWDNINQIIPLKELPSIIKNISHYEQLLFNNEVLNAVKTINGFDVKKKQAWELLYQAHKPKEDDCLSLYKSFNDFSDFLSENGLNIDELDLKTDQSSFVGANNMPSALGRMTSILSLCKPQDKQLQWKVMSQIDLGSQKALRAITFSKIKNPHRTCGFVFPGMNLNDLKDEDKQPNNNLYDQNLTWFKIDKLAPKPPAKKVSQAQEMSVIYDYLAYQNYRFPLSFYKIVMGKIDTLILQSKLDSEARRTLYALLLASTTGDNYRFHGNDPDKVIAQWDSILGNINNISVTGLTTEVKRSAINALYNVLLIPSSSVLSKLTAILTKPFQGVGALGLVKASNQKDIFEQDSKRLKALLEKYGGDIFQGMNFYDDADFTSKKNLLRDHLEICEAIDEDRPESDEIIAPVQGENIFTPKGFAKDILAHISTFHIQKEDLPGLSEAIRFATSKKIYTRVYPQNHPKAGLALDPTDLPQQSVPRDFFTFNTKLMPIETLSKLRRRYLFPKGHPQEGGEIPISLKAVPVLLTSEELEQLHLGKENFSENGAKFPIGWVFVYPEGHPRMGQRLSDEIIYNEKILSNPPDVAVLKERYFYPKGHAKENKLIPVTEAQVPGAVLKVGYLWTKPAQDAGKLFEDQVFEVNNIHCYTNSGNPRRDSSPGLFEKVNPIYPQGHPKAGQASGIFPKTILNTKSVKEYEENPFSKELFAYVTEILKDIQTITKLSDATRQLTAADLKEFIFNFGDKLDEILSKEEIKSHALADKFKQEHKRLVQLNAELLAQWEARTAQIKDQFHARANKDNKDFQEGALKDKESIDKAIKSAIASDEEVINIQKQLEMVAYQTHAVDVHPFTDFHNNRLTQDRKEIENQLLYFIQDKLGAYFPQDYFINKFAGEPSKNIQIIMEDIFKVEEIREFVKTIRNHFDKKSDEKQQIELITLLETVTSELSYPHKKQLLNFLSQTNLTSLDISSFLNLLKVINENGINNFTYFIQSANKFSQPVENLGEKAIFFLEKALPIIRENKNKLTEEADLIDLAIDLVLAADTQEIKNEQNIQSLLTTLYEDLVLASRDFKVRVIKEENDRHEVEQFKEKIGRLIQGRKKIESSEQISKLLEHLDFLSKDDQEEYEVSPASIKIIKVEKTGINKLFAQVGSFFGGNVPEYEEKTEIIPAVMGSRSKEKSVDASVVDAGLALFKKEISSYAYAFSETIGLINSMIGEYPGAKTQILEYCRHYLSFNTTDGSQVEEAFNNLQLLENEFKKLNDQNLVIGLCENFNAVPLSKGPSEIAADTSLNYRTLLDIFKQINSFKNSIEPEKTKKLILTVINSYLNNDKECNLNTVKILINRTFDNDFLKGDLELRKGQFYQQALEIAFSHAPFPSLDLIDQWIKEAVDSGKEDLPKEIQKNYDGWSREPVQRERNNGFNLKEAQEQNKKMQNFYSETELEALESTIELVKHIDTKDILAQIKEIRSNEVLQEAFRKKPDHLVALMAELLYRTKGLEALPGKTGRSFEINTTQYLAIHSMLKAGGHVTSQIGTGEGKSRIMMLSIACQYALGNTVDFVTSDVSLATRDYLEYQAFFKAMDAKTGLVTADMPPEQYPIGGIIFSDPTNLSLFRNKARTQGKGAKVIDPNEKRRALLLDEADKVYFDLVNRRFNYSAEGDPNLRDMEWIYELLIEFFAQPGKKELHKTDLDECNEEFISFALGKNLREEQKARLVYNEKIPLPVISKNQLEAWQSSALVALGLKYKENFAIAPNVSITTEKGPQIASLALLISEGEAVSGAKMSFGVQQCLHARLNMIKDGRLTDSNIKKEDLADFAPFYIDRETQIIYSSTSKSFLQEYKQGELLAVTGTAGSIWERKEAMKVYGKEDNEMTFIDIPRHKGLNREERPILLANNKEDQMQKILKSVLIALEKNQPILLVCENDDESLHLNDFLTKHLPKGKIKRIHATTPLEEELQYLETTAGIPGNITVSTVKLGRGKDFKISDEKAQKHGLKVIGTYLPRIRDYWQIVGRTARFGQKGESEFILDKRRTTETLKEYLKEYTGSDEIPIEFYTATEDFLKMLQDKMDIKEQNYRLIKNHIDGFQQELGNQFFNFFLDKISQENGEDKTAEIFGPWQQFLDKGDKRWNEFLPKIQEALSKDPPNLYQINLYLTGFETALQLDWKAMKSDYEARINSNILKSSQGKQLVEDNLKFNSRSLSLELTEKDIEEFQSEPGKDKKLTLKAIKASKFDKNLIGRAVVYENLSDSLRAFAYNFRAALQGEGPFFPNLRAVLNENMSWSEFVFGARGESLEEISGTKKVISEPTYKSIMRFFGDTPVAKPSEQAAHAPPPESAEDLAQKLEKELSAEAAKEKAELNKLSKESNKKDKTAPQKNNKQPQQEKGDESDNPSVPKKPPASPNQR